MIGKVLPISKITCSSGPNCHCQFCGQVRLLMEHERQRVAMRSDEQASEDALALTYIEQLERRVQ
ncbi:MAG: hypothetical protein ABR881_00570 [Candidatus Sulfotelmatobacter sp.]|jgi:hypothetical protein